MRPAYQWVMAVDRRTLHISLAWKIRGKIAPLAFIIQHKSNKVSVVSSSRCNLFAVLNTLKEKATNIHWWDLSDERQNKSWRAKNIKWKENPRYVLFFGFPLLFCVSRNTSDYTLRHHYIMYQVELQAGGSHMFCTAYTLIYYLKVINMQSWTGCSGRKNSYWRDILFYT